MVASSVSISSPVDGIELPNTIVRPGISVTWAGGVGPFDVEYTWDDDALFGNANGNRQQVTNVGVTAVDLAAPPADLAVLTAGHTWYVRANVIDQGDGGAAVADSQSFLYFDPIREDRFLYLLANVGVAFAPTDEPAGGWGTGGTTGADGATISFNRFLYLLANVGVAFTPTDDPAGGWGDGIGGTVAPDGDVIDFERFLSLLANVGVGFSTDEPPAGWGTGGTEHPDGDVRDDFARFLHLLANVEDTQPTPFIFRIEPSVAKIGDGIRIFGQGLVGASSPSVDPYAAEVRLYASPGTGGSYVVMPIVSYVAGETEDTIDVTVPPGAEVGTFDYVTVVHTAPSVVFSNQKPLEILGVTPVDAGWWIEAWEPDGSARRLGPLPAMTFSYEQILNEVGFGDCEIDPFGDGDLSGRQVLDAVSDPSSSPNPTTALIKVYLDGVETYSFYAQRDLLEWNEQGRFRIAGPGREAYLDWAIAFPQDNPANPIVAGDYIFGSTDNEVENGGGEDGDDAVTNGTFESGDATGWDPYVGGDPITVRAASQDTSRTGGSSMVVIPSNGSGIGAGVKTSLSGPSGDPIQNQVFVTAYIRDLAGAGDTILVKAVYDDAGETVLASDTIVLSASWQRIDLSFFVPTTNPSIDLVIVNSTGTARFYVDDVTAPYSTSPFERYGAGDTFHLDKTHVAADEFSIKVVPELQYGGIGQIIDTTPGRKYRVSAGVTGTAGDVLELSAQSGAVYPNGTVTLTGSPTFDSVSFEFTADAGEENVRLLLRNLSNPANPFWFDEWLAQPGDAATSPGGVLKPLFDAAQARGSLVHYSINFDELVDAIGALWDAAALGFAYQHGDTLRQVADRIVGLDACEWIVTNALEWRVANRIGSDLTTLPEDVPTVRATPAVEDDTELSRRTPTATFVFFEGADGTWTTASDLSLEAGLLRREQYVRNQEVTDGPTLGRYANATLADQRAQILSLSLSIARDDDFRPYRDFRIGDTILVDIFNVDGLENDPVPYRVRGLRVSGNAEDDISYDILVNNVEYRSAEAKSAVLLNRLLTEGTIRSLSAGRGTVGDVR